MANLYVELKYNDGSTKVISDCGSGVQYFNQISVPDKEKVDEMLISSKCDRSYSYKFTNTGEDYDLFAYGNTITIDMDINLDKREDGIISIANSEKIVFTENCQTVTSQFMFGTYNTLGNKVDLYFYSKVPPTISGNFLQNMTKDENVINTIYVPKNSIDEYKSTGGVFEKYSSLIQPMDEPADDNYIDTINIGGVDYKIKGEGGGGGSVDAYTKTESDERYAPKDEFASVSGDVENALGDIAALENDKQNKLSGDYVKDVEIGGSYINFNSMKFDGNNNGSKSVNFKTINNQPIFGAGNIQIDGGGGELPDVYLIQSISLNTYGSITNSIPFGQLSLGRYNLKSGGRSYVDGAKLNFPLVCNVKKQVVDLQESPFVICVCTQEEYNSATKYPEILYIIKG